MCPRTVGVMADRTTAQLLDAADEREAWAELVDRFGALVWSVVRGFRFDDATSADVNQAVWLRLYERRGDIREPERLASWLATTTRNEAISVQRSRARAVPMDDVGDDRGRERTEEDVGDVVVGTIDDAELRGVVGRAFEKIPASCQQLLRLMTADPPVDYATIAEIVDRPIGSLGPTRARCLAQLRRCIVDLEQGVVR